MEVLTVWIWNETDEVFYTIDYVSFAAVHSKRHQMQTRELNYDIQLCAQ